MELNYQGYLSTVALASLLPRELDSFVIKVLNSCFGSSLLLFCVEPFSEFPRGSVMFASVEGRVSCCMGRMRPPLSNSSDTQPVATLAGGGGGGTEWENLDAEGRSEAADVNFLERHRCYPRTEEEPRVSGFYSRGSLTLPPLARLLVLSQLCATALCGSASVSGGKLDRRR